MDVRFCAKPVVTAPSGRALGGGCEVAMAGARIVAAAETYMGLVEVGVGLIPGAGGCKEMVRRIVSPAMRFANTDPLPFCSRCYRRRYGEGLDERSGSALVRFSQKPIRS